MDPITANIRDKSLKMDEEFLYKSYTDFLKSKEYKDMINADKYYKYDHDILYKSRWAKGEKPEYPLPDEKIIDNQYAKMVDQKTNYLLSKPFKTEVDNEKYSEELKNVIDFRFRKILKQIGQDSINLSRGYLYGYRDLDGNLKFKKFNPLQIIPFYSDEDEEELDAFIRFYKYEEYLDGETKVKNILEFYNRIDKKVYEVESGKLKLLYTEPYTKLNGEAYTWTDRIPLFVFKSKKDARPLLNSCKSLQDGINTILSTFGNNMQEDARSTILVIHNYDGENVAKIRKKIMETGVLKVSSEAGMQGGVDTLKVEVNAENYESILKILKKALIENCRGFDAKDERISGSNFNQMNIQSMYNDIDLDASDMELEFQATLEELIEFVNSALGIKGKVKFTFDRNMMMNESQAITDFVNSNEISLQTRLGKHPWVEDVDEEMERIKEEELDSIKRMDDYNMKPFNKNLGKDTDGEIDA